MSWTKIPYAPTNRGFGPASVTMSTSLGKKQRVRIAFGPEALEKLGLEPGQKLQIFRGTGNDDGLAKLRKADSGRKLCAWDPPSPTRAGWVKLSCATAVYAAEADRLPEVDEVEVDAKACDNGDIIVKVPAALRGIG